MNKHRSIRNLIRRTYPQFVQFLFAANKYYAPLHYASSNNSMMHNCSHTERVFKFLAFPKEP